MILNPIPGIGSEHQIQIKAKGKLVGKGSRLFQIHDQSGQRQDTSFHLMNISLHYRRRQLSSTILRHNQTLTMDPCQEPTFHRPFLFIIVLHKELRFLTETTL